MDIDTLTMEQMKKYLNMDKPVWVACYFVNNIARISTSAYYPNTVLVWETEAKNCSVPLRSYGQKGQAGWVVYDVDED